MAKDTYYFSHDYNARNDEKILELRSEFGAEGYGVFWMIVETMAENENGGIKTSLIGGLSLAFGVTKDTIKKLIEYCLSIELFYNEEGYIFSRRMKKHKQFRTKLSEDGKKGAENRWKNNPPNGIPNGIPNAKERKGKERKEVINTDVEGKIEKVKAKLHGLPEMIVEVFDKCEAWQFKELKSFISNSTQSFESIAMNNKVMKTGNNFQTVLQAFVGMIQATNDYQESQHLRRFFGNWIAKKNGTLENFIQDYIKNSETPGKKMVY